MVINEPKNITGFMRSIFACLLVLGFGAELKAETFALDNNCIASVLNRSSQVNANGTFGIDNIIVPDGPVRVRVVL
ncbi:hypothetical protein JYT96_03145 [Gammaproteobacteria bacterium AH-315-C21]|nr:hypothetical protein [Gammaproteobacteria bacterium AH-315-C21]